QARMAARTSLRAACAACSAVSVTRSLRGAVGRVSALVFIMGSLPGRGSRFGLARLFSGWRDLPRAADPVEDPVRPSDTRSCCCNKNTAATCSERHRSADGSFPAAATTSELRAVAPCHGNPGQNGLVASADPAMSGMLPLRENDPREVGGYR